MLNNIRSINLKWIVLIGMSLLIFLGNFDFTAVALVLPQISKSFGSDLSRLQWIMISYIIASASFIIINTQICNFFDKKYIFIIGCMLFSLTSLFCGLSFNVDILITMRFLQGIGYALTFPLIYDFVFSIFPNEGRGFAISVLHFTTGIAQTVGPVLGGVISYYFGWRTVFFINFPICVLIIFFTIMNLPKDNYQKKSSLLGVSNAFLMFLIIVTLMLVLNQNLFELNKNIIKNTFWGIFICLILLIIFIFREKNNPIPVFNRSLLLDKQFIRINIIRFFIQIIFVIFIFIPNLLLQNILGYSSTFTGIIYSSMTLVFAMFSIISGKIIDRHGPKYPLITGIISLILGCLFLVFLPYTCSLSIIFSSFIVIGIALGLTFPSSLFICLSNTKKENRAAASSIFLMNALLGCSFGVAFSGLILSITTKFKLYNILNIGKLSLNNIQETLLGKLMTGVEPLKNVSSHILNIDLIHYATSSFLISLQIIMLICLMISVVALWLSFKLFRKKVI